MDSLYFLAMLAGIAWLCIWSALTPEQRLRGWWPFEMRENAPQDGSDKPTDNQQGVARRRGTGVAEWRGRSPRPLVASLTEGGRPRRPAAQARRRHDNGRR